MPKDFLRSLGINVKSTIRRKGLKRGPKPQELCECGEPLNGLDLRYGCARCREMQGQFYGADLRTELRAQREPEVVEYRLCLRRY